MATGAFRASRVDMMQGGVPVDYVDALLDDQYMADLIEQTNQRMNKRASKMRRHFIMQKVIFWVLVTQALVGVWVAFYKTLLQPDTIYGATGKMQDAEFVLMLDASRAMGNKMSVQHTAATKFTGMLKDAMAESKRRTRAEAKHNILEKYKDARGWLPFLNALRPRNARGRISIRGGELRVATGIFNGDSARLLHSFTADLKEQEKALSSVQTDSYKSVAFWLPALELCEKTASGSKDGSARYCAIIGDDSAMCQRVVAKPVDDFCRKFPEFCPPEDERENLGDSFLEYAQELERCTSFVTGSLQPPPSSAQAIMMFTIGSEEEGQLRLKNPSFRDFIRKTTDCKIEKNTTSYVNAYGDTQVIERFDQDAECLKFIMAKSFEDLMAKSERIAELLQSKITPTHSQNEGYDPRYVWFLLLPLNLLIFLAWTQILRCFDRLKAEADKAMGKKKKVIKVRKFLVEKPEDPESPAAQRRVQLSEVELAEMASLQPLLEYGAPMLMRARLKGGHLRADMEKGTPDGDGKAFDPNSNWIFELADDEGGEEGGGRKVRIRNNKGELLIADEEGTRFASLPKRGAEPGSDVDRAGKAAEFLLDQTDGELDCRLGDAIQLKALGTGKYLKVQKDGKCNAQGASEEEETQFVIDRGGACIGCGAVVTLTSSTTGNFMSGLPNGDVNADSGGKEWRFWKIERKEEEGDNSIAISRGGLQADAHGHPLHIKEGDVVTLTGFNQQMLQVDGTANKVRCGGESSSSSAPGSPTPSVTQDFVIERVGMGLCRKYDKVLRAGMQVCLRPVQPEGNDVEERKDYLRVNGDGSVTPDGKVTQKEIVLTIDAAKLSDMAMPLYSTLLKGDVDLLVSPLWSKADVKRLGAMTAGWTEETDFASFKGPVVVASDKGTYAPPKATGANSGWVAVVNESVDIPKAARQAKLQGATGLIIRCEDVLSLNKRGKKGKDASVPELPAVFVDKNVGEGLNERGIVLNGCEFRKRYVTDAMRALGTAAEGGDEDVFSALGKGMLERSQEWVEEEVEERVQQERMEEEESAYKWKINSNTHYLWGRSGGGATMMKVNYGQVAPPSALNRTKDQADASSTKKLRVQRSRKSQLGGERRSLTGLAVLEPDELKGRRFVSELEQVVNAEEAQPSDLEQLAEESDFKIEYQFNEMEVGAGEKMDDVEEQEMLAEQEAVISKIGVPQKRFWLVALGLLASTVFLMGFLGYILVSDYTPPKPPLEEEEDHDVELFQVGQVRELWKGPARLASFLSS